MLKNVNVILYLAVLIGGDGDELGLGENKGVLPPSPPQHIPGFNHVNSGLVPMQRVEDDLEMMGKEEQLFLGGLRVHAGSDRPTHTKPQHSHIPVCPVCCW